MNDEMLTTRLKYRFWLAFTLMLMSGVFATLGMGAFAAGRGLAEEGEAGAIDRTILTFDLVGIFLLVMVPVSIWAAYKLFIGATSDITR